MTKLDKLYEQLLSSTARSTSFRDIERLILAFGFEHQRTRGSHRQYGHRLVAAVLTVNPDGKGAHRYQVRLLLEMIEEFGLSMDG